MLCYCYTNPQCVCVNVFLFRLALFCLVSFCASSNQQGAISVLLLTLWSIEGQIEELTRCAQREEQLNCISLLLFFQQHISIVRLCVCVCPFPCTIAPFLLLRFFSVATWRRCLLSNAVAFLFYPFLCMRLLYCHYATSSNVLLLVTGCCGLLARTSKMGAFGGENNVSCTNSLVPCLETKEETECSGSCGRCSHLLTAGEKLCPPKKYRHARVASQGNFLAKGKQ